MTEFDKKYFKEFNYSKASIYRYLKSARKDLNIAKNSQIPDVIFQFSYNAFIKLGISLVAGHGYKINSRMGHHIKILEKVSEILDDTDIEIYGNSMRKIRNTELYDGGDTLLTKKQAEAYLVFVSKVFSQSDNSFKKTLGTLF